MGAPKLSDDAIEKAVSVLDGWHGKLTWDRYLAMLSVDLGHKYTKVAMLNQRRIRAAWDSAKKRTRDSVEGVGHGDVAVAVSRKRIDTLQARVERLQRENHQLLEQFVLWAHNATRMGLTKKDLDRPLPVTENPKSRASPREGQ